MSRKSSLDLALDHPGFPQMAPHRYALANPADWFSACGQLLVRNLGRSERLDVVCKDLELTLDFARDIVGLVNRQAGTIIKKHFEPAGLGYLLPHLPTRESAWLDANQIGRSIFELAQRDIDLARQFVWFYAAAANSDRQIVLTVANPRHIRVAREFIEFFIMLRIDDRKIGLVGYKDVNKKHADLDDLAVQLRLTQDAPRRLEFARNTGANSPVGQAGIAAFRKAPVDYVVDQTFFSAMLLAAAVEAWRFVLPVASTPMSGISGQQIPDMVKTKDPKSKLPLAAATDGIDQAQCNTSLHDG